MLYFHIFVVILCSHESLILKFLYEFIKFFKRIGIIIFVYSVFFEYFYRGVWGILAPRKGSRRLLGSKLLEGFWHVVWGGVAVCP